MGTEVEQIHKSLSFKKEDDVISAYGCKERTKNTVAKNKEHEGT